jgi:hypothetical protein
MVTPMRSGTLALPNNARVCVWNLVGSATPLTLANPIPQRRIHLSSPSLETFLTISLTASPHPRTRLKPPLIKCSLHTAPHLRHTTNTPCNMATVPAPLQARDRQPLHIVLTCNPRAHITPIQPQTQGIVPRGATHAGTSTAHVTRIPMRTLYYSDSRSNCMVLLALCAGCRSTVVTPHVLSCGACKNSAIS